MTDPAALYGEPNAIAGHYTRFDVANRLLLSGHSHQAWPDRAFQAQQQAWLDAARFVDGKWSHAFERADRVRRGYARLLGEPDAEIALAPATHELLVRFLSGLPLRDRPRLVTSDGEFHTIRRQLDRLAEEGVEIVKMAVDPVDTLTERMAGAVDDRTAAALVSSVLFMDARIVPGLDRLATACERHGAELLVDAYHHLNVVPFSVAGMGLERAFVVGGGYKYCQLGEGNGFMRVPAHCRMRPAVTGWFSEFGLVVEGEGGTGTGTGRVAYPDGPDRFAGATYDPVSHYRGAAVFEFFEEMALTPELLREVSRHQIGLLAREFDALDLDPDLIGRERDADLAGLAGFLSVRTPRAAELEARLRDRNVFVDHREDRLRIGPAPYLTDRQLRDAVAALGECVGSLTLGS